MTMDMSTAQGAYGFNSWSPATPGGVAIMSETQQGISNLPSGVLGKLPIGHQNPLMWLLVLLLIWTGYLYGGFDLGIKKIGSSKFKIG